MICFCFQRPSWAGPGLFSAVEPTPRVADRRRIGAIINIFYSHKKIETKVSAWAIADGKALTFYGVRVTAYFGRQGLG